MELLSVTRGPSSGHLCVRCTGPRRGSGTWTGPWPATRGRTSRSTPPPARATATTTAGGSTQTLDKGSPDCARLTSITCKGAVDEHLPQIVGVPGSGEETVRDETPLGAEDKVLLHIRGVVQPCTAESGHLVTSSHSPDAQGVDSDQEAELDQSQVSTTVCTNHSSPGQGWGHAGPRRR